MIARPEKYDEIEVNEFDYVPLELGGHKGIIKLAEEYTSEISKNTSLKVTVDTDKNDKQPNYFQTQYDNNTNADKKWSNGGIKYVSLKEDENCVRMLKSFITAVENSNPGFTYDWNKEVDQLNGKKVGLVFGLEEYENGEGQIKLATKLNQFRSIDKVDNAQIPKVRTLNNGYIDYDDYMECVETQKQNNNSSDEIVISDEDLPF